MSSASNFTENLVLDWTLTTGSVTRPTAWYVALFNNTSGNAATNLETGVITDEVSTSGTAYARIAVAFGAAASGVTSNTATLTSAAATASWGTITHLAIVSTVSGAATVYYWGPLTTSKTVDTGDAFQISANQLTITLV